MILRKMALVQVKHVLLEVASLDEALELGAHVPFECEEQRTAEIWDTWVPSAALRAVLEGPIITMLLVGQPKLLWC